MRITEWHVHVMYVLSLSIEYHRHDYRRHDRHDSRRHDRRHDHRCGLCRLNYIHDVNSKNTKKYPSKNARLGHE